MILMRPALDVSYIPLGLFVLISEKKKFFSHVQTRLTYNIIFNIGINK